MKKISKEELKQKLTKKNIAIGTLATALVLTSGMGAAAAADHIEEERERRGPISEDAREALEERDYTEWQEALAEADKAPDVLVNFTEDQFNRFAKMHELREAGDKEGAAEIREELGLPERGNRGNHPHKGKILEITFDEWAEKAAEKGLDENLITQDTFARLQAAAEGEDKEAMKELREELGIEGHGPRGHKGKHLGAILDMSYDEWAEKAADRGFDAEGINQETFSKLQASATLAQDGDREAAKELLEEAGIERPHHDRGEHDDDDRRGPRGFDRLDNDREDDERQFRGRGFRGAGQLQGAQ